MAIVGSYIYNIPDGQDCKQLQLMTYSWPGRATHATKLGCCVKEPMHGSSCTRTYNSPQYIYIDIDICVCVCVVTQGHANRAVVRVGGGSRSCNRTVTYTIGDYASKDARWKKEVDQATQSSPLTIGESGQASKGVAWKLRGSASCPNLI